MHIGEQRLLISMVEEVYMDHHHTSFASAMFELTNEFSISDEQLFRRLKRQYNMRPTGRISRVVSKRVYDECEATGKELVYVIENACSGLDTHPTEVSDDMLCRYLESH